LIVTRDTLAKRGDALRRFVLASAEGWKSYLANPGPANELIKRDNPNMKDEQIAFAIGKLKEAKLLDGGDAAKMGIGIMTDERWKATYEMMVKTGLLRPEVDWKAGYTLRFVKDLKVMP